MIEGRKETIETKKHKKQETQIKPDENQADKSKYKVK